MELINDNGYNDLEKPIEIQKLKNVPEVPKGTFITYITDSLNDEESKIFANSFYMYLKHDQDKDFAIDLDSIWGFNCSSIIY